MTVYTKSVTANADALAAVVTSLNSFRGAGKDLHLPVGLGPNHRARSYVGFAQAEIVKACTGATSLVGATLKLYIGPGVHQTNGATPRMWVQRLTQALNAGTSGGGTSGREGAWSETNGGGVRWLKGGSHDGVTFTTSAQVDKVITIPGSGTGWISIDVADLIEAAGLPATVAKRSGAAGPGGSLFGFRLASFDDTLATRAIEFLSLESGTRPYLLLTLDDNHAPNAPIITAPADNAIVTTDSGEQFTVEFTHDDPLDKRTHWTKARVQVFTVGTTVAQMDSGAVLPRNEVTVRKPAGTTPQKGKVTVGRNDPKQKDPPLIRRTARLWRIMTVDDQGKPGKWSTPRTVTPNAEPQAVNIRVEQGTRTPTITVGIADLDSVLGGTNGRIRWARAVIYLDFPQADASGRTFTTMLDTGRVDPGALPLTATLPYSGSPSVDLDWGQQYRGFVEVGDDSNATTSDSYGVSDQVVFRHTPRIITGPATVLPSGKSPVQTALRYNVTVGDTLPFDAMTVRWYREQDSQVPYWAQTHAALSTTLSTAPGAVTNFKVAGANGAAIPSVAVGDILRIAKPGGPTDDRTVTVVGTAGSGGTGITVSAALTAGHAIGDTVRAMQMTRAYAAAGPIGPLGNDWGSEPWIDAAVRPTGAVNYGPLSERRQNRIDAKPMPPGPFSVVGGVDSGKGYIVVGGASPPTLSWRYNDPDVLLGYADPRTSRLLSIRVGTTPFAHVTGSPFTVGGVSDDYLVGGGVLTKDVTYLTNAFDTDTAGQQGPAAPAYGVFRWSTAPVLGTLRPAPWTTLATSLAADDIIDTAAPHSYVAGQAMYFGTLTGGAGLVVGTTYYVIAANLGSTTLQVSATPGGAAVNFTTNITAGTIGTRLIDPTPLYTWTPTLVAGKTTKQFQLVLTDITDNATTGPVELYDSGIVPQVVASGVNGGTHQVPPYMLTRTGRTIQSDLTVWDTDNLQTTSTWYYVTEFVKPATLTGLVLVPDQVESEVVGTWSAAGKDTNFYEYIVDRRRAGEEFARILTDQVITTESFTDEDAPIGAVTDYRVTQHTGALQSDGDSGSEESTTITPAMRWRVKYSDAYNFDLEEVQTYRVDEQLLEATLQPLPGDDLSGRTMGVTLSGGEGPRTVTLSLLLPPDRLYQLPWLVAIRRDIALAGDGAYMTLKSPDGMVFRCRPGAVPIGDGKQDWQTSDVTFLEVEA